MSLLEDTNILPLQTEIQNVITTQAIAQPMAPRSLTKKIYKLIKKSHAQKDCLRTGLKEVQTRVRKGEKGIAVFAGNVSPIDIMVHMPGVCEDKEIPYCYTPSREDLGGAMGLKRSTIMVLIREHEDYKELYDEVMNEISALRAPFS